VIEHIPAATIVKVAPETLQTDAVVETKLTTRPEEALAPIANGAVPNGTFPSAPNVIVCDSKKAALALELPFITTLHDGLPPLHEPLHPENVQPLASAAFSVTFVPFAYFALHTPLPFTQSIRLSALVTAP
jgi:hypothetical protein